MTANLKFGFITIKHILMLEVINEAVITFFLDWRQNIYLQKRYMTQPVAASHLILLRFNIQSIICLTDMTNLIKSRLITLIYRRSIKDKYHHCKA